MILKEGMQFFNYFSGETLEITNINNNIIEYNFPNHPSSVPYLCNEQQFHDWVKKVSKYPEE